MGSSAPRHGVGAGNWEGHKIAIFGGGRVGLAMAAELPGVPVVHRGGDEACDIACVCWPAQAVAGFAAAHPRGAAARLGVVTFCNGSWAVADGARHAGICYVRASHRGDRAKVGHKGWRVGDATIGLTLRAAGLGVVVSRSSAEHEAQIWSKSLYLLPMALACADLAGTEARLVTSTTTYAEWYDIVRCAAVEAIGEKAVEGVEPRVRFLAERTPRGWFPSPSKEEVAYFRRRLGCND